MWPIELITKRKINVHPLYLLSVSLKCHDRNDNERRSWGPHIHQSRASSLSRTASIGHRYFTWCLHIIILSKIQVRCKMRNAERRQPDGFWIFGSFCACVPAVNLLLLSLHKPTYVGINSWGSSNPHPTPITSPRVPAAARRADRSSPPSIPITSAFS